MTNDDQYSDNYHRWSYLIIIIIIIIFSASIYCYYISSQQRFHTHYTVHTVFFVYDRTI